MNIRPFTNKEDAVYWGGGVVVEAIGGGWWSLHGRNTPSGSELYYVGQVGPRGHDTARRAGWPKNTKERYVWAIPDNGGSATICKRI